jgi:hypothetical protein
VSPEHRQDLGINFLNLGKLTKKYIDTVEQRNKTII